MNLQLQEQLVIHTQQLIAECLDTGAYPEAIAFGALLKDLSESYKVFGSNSKQAPVVQIPRKPQQQQAFNGNAAFGVARTIPQQQQQQPQRQEPAKPTTYNWPDGFQGVALPPNPEQQRENGDYWNQQ